MLLTKLGSRHVNSSFDELSELFNGHCGGSHQSERYVSCICQVGQFIISPNKRVTAGIDTIQTMSGRLPATVRSLDVRAAKLPIISHFKSPAKPLSY